MSWENPVTRVAMQSNAWYCGGYGIKGAGVVAGTPTLTALATPYAWSSNVLFGCSSGVSERHEIQQLTLRSDRGPERGRAARDAAFRAWWSRREHAHDLWR